MWFYRGTIALLLVAAACPSPAVAQMQTMPACEVGLALPTSYCASIFADNIGHARHLVAAPNGVLYVNTWSGAYYRNDTPPAGGFVVALKDTKGKGHADVITRFGAGAAEGSAGGTGIAFYNGAIYAEENDRIVRYKLPANAVVPTGKPDVILSGMPLDGDHPMHPFAIDAKGNLYVSMGSASNACQDKNRMAKSPGAPGCPELTTRAGIWRYDATKTGQKFSPAERYATGIRNIGGITFDAMGRMYATQHGRDQLAENWPDLYAATQGAELPAEELLQVERGDNFGWPMCYFDGFQKKLVQAPEYGGDGGKSQGTCAPMKPPAAAFPAHWAPNDVLFYSGTQFPAGYRGGAFIAFHGSWNRAPGPQGGYNVVFQPFADGKPAGDYIVFADGFAGAAKDPGSAAFRPAGLALGADGALYIADDSHGRIWKVDFKGAPDAQVAAAPAVSPSPEAASPDAALAKLPLPPGVTLAQLTLGSRVFHGQVKHATCTGCHGTQGKGAPQGPDLTDGTWLWGDGSLKAIAQVIADGVRKPKTYTGAMPPMGGVQLSQDEIAATAAYVWAISHPAGK